MSLTAKGNGGEMRAKDTVDRRGGVGARRVKSRGKGRCRVKREPPAIFPAAVELSSFVSSFFSFLIFLINYRY